MAHAMTSIARCRCARFPVKLCQLAGPDPGCPYNLEEPGCLYTLEPERLADSVTEAVYANNLKEHILEKAEDAPALWEHAGGIHALAHTSTLSSRMRWLSEPLPALRATTHGPRKAAHGERGAS